MSTDETMRPSHSVTVGFSTFRDYANACAAFGGGPESPYRGWKLRVYYMADGTLPPPHEAGALIAQASAPATSSRHAC